LDCKNINPNPIKKIMNKKVTLNGQKELLPVFYRSSPIIYNHHKQRSVFLNQKL